MNPLYDFQEGEKLLYRGSNNAEFPVTATRLMAERVQIDYDVIEGGSSLKPECKKVAYTSLRRQAFGWCQLAISQTPELRRVYHCQVKDSKTGSAFYLVATDGHRLHAAKLLQSEYEQWRNVLDAAPEQVATMFETHLQQIRVNPPFPSRIEQMAIRRQMRVPLGNESDKVDLRFGGWSLPLYRAWVLEALSGMPYRVSLVFKREHLHVIGHDRIAVIASVWN